MEGRRKTNRQKRREAKVQLEERKGKVWKRGRGRM